MAEQPEKEVRFAVVMYGGVSLAIYINGVTQELMNMVRATARSREKDGTDYHIPDAKLSGVEKVYRNLGDHLKARFVVDILSGTSAGGINAIYLAKALANDQQIDQLKELWITKGDIEQLVNDKQSVKKLGGLVAPTQPTSLLNSQAMYYQLLLALQGMKTAGSPEPELSPYVGELDLFITATDLAGLSLPIRTLSGDVAQERRFRNVFHFQYATPEATGIDDPTGKKELINDFKKENDPFLAFAARCTSSFPFAFEPMQLQDIEGLLGSGDFKDYSYQSNPWAKFYKDYEPKGFPELSFGDGGYLDNKPFSYATATLNRRRADLPVDRKLVYIEPAPERIQEKKGKPQRPDAIANVLLALLTLPRYETIREDLQAVNERNDLIQNVNSIIQNIESVSQGLSLQPWMPSPRWREQFLDELVHPYGPGYLIYHQLRVKETLQDLSEMLVRGMGWEEESPQATDLLALLRAWRHIYYKTSSKEKEPRGGIKRKSENDLLFRLDTRWRIRRLHYLRGLIDTLLKDLSEGTFLSIGSKSKSILHHTGADWKVDQSNQADYRSALLRVKKGLNEAYTHLRGRGRAMRARNIVAEENSTDYDREAYKKSLQDLKAFLEGKSQAGTSQLEELRKLSVVQAANKPLPAEQEKYYQECLQRLEELSEVLYSREAKPKNKGLIRDALSHLSDGIESVLKPSPKSEEESKLSDEMKTPLDDVRKCLTHYHERFEYFDMLTFPVTYGTNIGESDEVEIIRISPENATMLLENLSYTKLAGTKLGNFGAFFHPQWRENDMLWGRLDGAECLIKAVWPKGQEEDERQKFIRDAHQAILEEFLLPKDKLTTFQARYDLSPVKANELQQAVERLTRDKEQLIENFKRTYQVDPEFPPEPTLKVVSRASSVLGQLMGGLADTYPQLNRPAGIFSRFGQIFFALLSVAIPKSLPNLIFRTLIGSIYIVELFLVAGGRVLVELDTPGRGIDFTTLGTVIARLGLQAFIVTLLAHLLIVILGKVITHNWNVFGFLRTARTILLIIFVLGAFILMFSGLLYLGAFPSLEESFSSLRGVFTPLLAP